MNTLAIQVALQTQTQLVYKGTLANDHTMVATALKQIKKLVQFVVSSLRIRIILMRLLDFRQTSSTVLRFRPA